MADDPEAYWAKVSRHVWHNVNEYAGYARRKDLSPFTAVADPDELLRSSQAKVYTPAEVVAVARSARAIVCCDSIRSRAVYRRTGLAEPASVRGEGPAPPPPEPPMKLSCGLGPGTDASDLAVVAEELGRGRGARMPAGGAEQELEICSSLRLVGKETTQGA